MNTAALALVLSLPICSRQDDEAPPEPEVLPGAVRLDLKTGEQAARVPFVLGDRRPIPVVEAMLNGEGPFKFYFDTGASVCVLHTGFAKELGLPVLGPTEIGDHTANARIPAERVHIESLQLGGIQFDALPAIAFDRSSLQGDTIRGVLGLPLFHQHLLTVDYGALHLEVSDAKLPEQGQGIIGYEATPLPEFEIDIAGKTLTCHVDSGSPTGFALPASVVADLPHKTEPKVLGKARTVNSEFELLSVQLDATITVAGNEFVDPEVLYNEILPNALIGYQILKNLTVSIDQRSQRLRIVPAQKQAAAAPAARRLGAGLGLRGDVMFVSMVVAGSPAEAAGLKVGDVLLEVDGEPVTHALVRAALTGSEPMRLKVERGEETVDLVVFAG